MASDLTAQLTQLLDLHGIEGDDLGARLANLSYELHTLKDEIEVAHQFLDRYGVIREQADGKLTVMGRLHVVTEPGDGSTDRLVKGSHVVSWVRREVGTAEAEKIGKVFDRKPQPVR